MTPLHVLTYCNDQGDPCKYAEQSYDPQTYTVVVLCTKLSPNAYANLQKSRQKQSGGMWSYKVPTGDNCQGYPYLKALPQGFDEDKKKT